MLDLFYYLGAAVVVFVVLGAMVIIPAIPEALWRMSRERRDANFREIEVQARLARQQAIADAAIAARARGEKFVPPADYDQTI